MNEMNKTRSGLSRRLTLGVLLAALAWPSTQAWAQAPRDPVVLNFVNADIPSVIKAVGELTGKNFVIDPRVKGTVIITSARAVPRAQVYDPAVGAAHAGLRRDREPRRGENRAGG